MFAMHFPVNEVIFKKLFNVLLLHNVVYPTIVMYLAMTT